MNLKLIINNADSEAGERDKFLAGIQYPDWSNYRNFSLIFGKFSHYFPTPKKIRLL